MENLASPTSVDFDNLDILSELSRLLKYDFSTSLSAAVGEYPEKSFRYLKITAQLCDGSLGTDNPVTNYRPLPIHLVGNTPFYVFPRGAMRMTELSGMG
jgi:hypothetical protein